MEIKILGPGCPKCKQTEDLVRKVVIETGVDANVEKVSDLMEIAGYGVFGTPAVVVDGEVKSVGKIPTMEEIKTWMITNSASCLKGRTFPGQVTAR